MRKEIPNKKGSMSIPIILIISLLFCVVFILPIVLKSKKEDGAVMFQKACQTHAIVLKDHYNTLLWPGSRSNESRQQLNENLQTILTSNISNEVRLQISISSLPHHKELQNQIDTIIDEAPLLKKSQNELKKKLDIFYLEKKQSKTIQVIVEKTDDYIQKSQHAQEALHTMNTQSIEIFERIKKDLGLLSDEHIEKLNSDIPLAEQNFDSLTEYYRNVSKLKEEIISLCDSFLLIESPN